MKKLLVTGGLGFIGSYFVDLALKRGYYIINVDKKTYAARTDVDFHPAVLTPLWWSGLRCNGNSAWLYG